MLWALEQTLRSGHQGAVLAWLPARLPGGTMPLRRLQLAAQTHPGPVFLLREEAAAGSASPAPLRLHLACAGADALQVQVLKRRGPPLAQPLVLQLPAVLAPGALARARAPKPRVSAGLAQELAQDQAVASARGHAISPSEDDGDQTF
jgi:protein ImuA